MIKDTRGRRTLQVVCLYLEYFYFFLFLSFGSHIFLLRPNCGCLYFNCYLISLKIKINDNQETLRISYISCLIRFQTVILILLVMYSICWTSCLYHSDVEPSIDLRSSKSINTYIITWYRDCFSNYSTINRRKTTVQHQITVHVSEKYYFNIICYFKPKI